MKRQEELDFYQTYFADPTVQWCRDWERMEEIAHREAHVHGLGALDALHIAAAYLLDADELVTTERPSKPIYRNGLVHVRHFEHALFP